MRAQVWSFCLIVLCILCIEMLRYYEIILNVHVDPLLVLSALNEISRTWPNNAAFTMPETLKKKMWRFLLQACLPVYMCMYVCTSPFMYTVTFEP